MKLSSISSLTPRYFSKGADGDVFVEVFPVDAYAAADEPPSPAPGLLGVAQRREPSTAR